MNHIRIQVNEKLYLKDPDSSELGRRIIKTGVELIDFHGFEDFTFGKLAKEVGSPESTIYRYFENKHKFLLFLMAWYWSWLEYRLVFETSNVDSPEDWLKKAIRVITQPMVKTADAYIDVDRLNKIVVCESSKAYLHKHVDNENREGFFTVYKRIVQRISEAILKINPDFGHSHTLVSTIFEGAHHQKFFAQHIPSLTDVGEDDQDITNFFTTLTFRTIHS